MKGTRGGHGRRATGPIKPRPTRRSTPTGVELLPTQVGQEDLSNEETHFGDRGPRQEEARPQLDQGRRPERSTAKPHPPLCRVGPPRQVQQTPRQEEAHRGSARTRSRSPAAQENNMMNSKVATTTPPSSPPASVSGESTTSPTTATAAATEQVRSKHKCVHHREGHNAHAAAQGPRRHHAARSEYQKERDHLLAQGRPAIRSAPAVPMAPTQPTTTSARAKRRQKSELEMEVQVTGTHLDTPAAGGPQRDGPHQRDGCVVCW